MSKFAGVLSCGLLAGMGVAGTASAQYYPPGPGYYPPAPGYYGEYYRPRPLGDRCEVWEHLPYERGRRAFCRIVRARPLGAPCECPPPAAFPNHPWSHGRVVP